MTRSLAALASLVVAVACSSSTPGPANRRASPRAPVPATPRSPSARPVESPVAVEQNPPGDIPDTQRFVVYTSQAGGYQLKVPEGWAQTEQGSSVVFADKLHSVRVDVEQADRPRTPESVRSIDEPKLRAASRAFEEVAVQAVTLPAGAAVLLRYRENSDPDPVTGKVIRLEVDRYEIYRNGRVAILSLSGPAGADNVDVWRLISRSFGWLR